MSRLAINFLRLSWLGHDRIVAYSAILLIASAASMFPLFLRAMGVEGSDFLAFWSAGKLALSGQPSDAYNLARIAELQTSTGSENVFAFVNPPPLLLAIWPLGYLDYQPAWIMWTITTYLIWLAASRHVVAKLAWPLAAYPGALIAAWHAQTGFLTSSSQSFIAKWIDNKPFLAGACIGALIIKPHLAVLFPFALLAARQFKAIAGAAFAILALALASWVVFGIETISAYTRTWSVSEYLLTTGSHEFFLRQVTIYSMFRAASLPTVATIAQAGATICTIALIMYAWSKKWPINGKLALLFAATPLATPYLFSYDLPFLVLPTCWLALNLSENSLGGWARPIVLLLYVSPLVTRGAALPLGCNLMPLVSVAMTVLVWRALANSRLEPLPARDG